ncbi:hypothetical protein GC722_02710 [Auraticoccus sp. F435]|uniref:Uncharacterized protein n=1 Tax=Auraticoccus cholistanensis TaxID=2656650 RepID=A0A6A9UTN4_9ACTN|nr:hypothetical protein [Auraticoccus cholistanensis]MVA74944.1 hypothetical protein [Auraticoccus cholistanensis]
MTDERRINALLQAGLDDWISLHDVVWEAMEGDDSDESRRRTIRLLGQLFDDGLAVPGDLGASGFEDWPGTPGTWLHRAWAELERLGWNPMGAGFWLRLTELGEREARERGLE